MTTEQSPSSLRENETLHKLLNAMLYNTGKNTVISQLPKFDGDAGEINVDRLTTQTCENTLSGRIRYTLGPNPEPYDRVYARLEEWYKRDIKIYLPHSLDLVERHTTYTDLLLDKKNFYQDHWRTEPYAKVCLLVVLDFEGQ